MNYIFWIKVYNTIYIFWSYSNQKVIFWFIILFYLYVVLLGGVCSNLASYIWFLEKLNSIRHVMTGYNILKSNDMLWQDICIQCWLVCPELLCIFLQGYIYHLLTSKCLHVEQWFRTRYLAGVSWCRAVTDCATWHLAEIGIGCSYMSIFIHSDMNW